jgi:hypothetical protein
VVACDDKTVLSEEEENTFDKVTIGDVQRRREALQLEWAQDQKHNDF